MAGQNKFFTNLISAWNDLGGNNEELYCLFEDIKGETNNSPIGQKREELLALLFKNCNQGLNQVLPKKIRESVFTAPLSENARVRFNGWSSGKNISDQYLVSIVVFTALLAFHGKELLYPAGYDCFEDDNLNLEKIIPPLCEELEIKNHEYIKKITLDCRYYIPFLLAVLLHSRYENNMSTEGQAIADKIKKWLVNRMNEITHISNDADLAGFQKIYYEALWEETKTIDVRDMVGGGGLSSISESAQIANLYIVPTFLKENHVVDPINPSRRFSRIIIANSGCGKSTFLQATVTSNIYEELCAMESESIQCDATTEYKIIKQRLGIGESYLPVFVKASAINDIEVKDLPTTLVENIAVGSNSELYNENIGKLLAVFEKKKRILLLLDALDEIDGNERKERMGKMIDDFMARFPSASMIITSRAIDLKDYYNRSFYGKLEKITLNLFKEEEIHELITKWMQIDISLASDSDIEQKYRYFTENKYLAKLAQNPYMLSHALWYSAHNVNATPQKILSHVINNLIEKRWPLYKYTKYNITPEYMREVLSCLAWEMTEENIHVIPAKDLVSRFAKAADQVESDGEVDRTAWPVIVKEMNARAGLLILEEAGYIFQCDVIEHFLASEWALSRLIDTFRLQRDNQYKIIRGIENYLPSLIDPYWSDVVLMMFTPDHRYDLHKKDNITPALFRYLLHKTADTLDPREVNVIGNIFIGLLRNTFGRNRITNIGSDGGTVARRQILRFLFNNQVQLNCNSFIHSAEVAEEFTALTEGRLINYEEESR